MLIGVNKTTPHVVINDQQLIKRILKNEGISELVPLTELAIQTEATMTEDSEACQLAERQRECLLAEAVEELKM